MGGSFSKWRWCDVGILLGHLPSRRIYAAPCSDGPGVALRQNGRRRCLVGLRSATDEGDGSSRFCQRTDEFDCLYKVGESVALND